MKKRDQFYPYVRITVAVAAGLLAVAAPSALAQATFPSGVCVTRVGAPAAECLTPLQLREEYLVGAVKFQANAAAAITASDSQWPLLAYLPPSGAVAQAPLALVARFPQHLAGEVAMMEAADALCAEFQDVGITCTREYLTGQWRTYGGTAQAPDVQVTFTSRTLAPLAGDAAFTAVQWACVDGEAGQKAWVEVACEGLATSSHRLVYLTGQSPLHVTVQSCAATGRRQAVADAAVVAARACPADGSYEASAWAPAALAKAQGFIVSHPTRVQLSTQASLYFLRWP